VIRITPTEAERSAGAFSNVTLEKASRCIRTDGALVLEDIVKPELILTAREVFAHKYDRYSRGPKNDDARQVGDRRLMITVDLEPPFERRELLAIPWLLPVLGAAFEDNFVLDGARRQSIHQDGADIFPQAALNRLLPVVAITVGIPLLEMMRPTAQRQSG